MDLARSIQDVTEEIVLKMARHARKTTGAKYLCLAGGVTLALGRSIFAQVGGEPADAATCLAWGMADEVVPAGEARAAAGRWAAKVAALPPLPVRMTKEAVNATANALHHATSYMDRDQYLLTVRTEDFREGATAFFEKRPGTFSGN